jgi:hypothetical protein
MMLKEAGTALHNLDVRGRLRRQPTRGVFLRMDRHGIRAPAATGKQGFAGVRRH